MQKEFKRKVDAIKDFDKEKNRKRKNDKDYTTELIEGVKVSSRVEPTKIDMPTYEEEEEVTYIDNEETEGLDSYYDKENVCPNCYFSWDEDEY